MGPPPVANLRARTPILSFQKEPADHILGEEQAYGVSIAVRLFLSQGGCDAGRDFYGAVGSRSTVGGSPSAEHVPLRAVQRK